MASAQTRSWADVYVDDATQRPALESKALFFVTRAPERCFAAGLSAAELAIAYSIQARQEVRPILAGRSIHTKVLSGRPVSYHRAVGFINVSREPLLRRNQIPLETSDVIACVFRLKDPSDVAAALGAGPQDIATACNLRFRIVEAALTRYRLSLTDAMAIWRYFRTLQSAGLGRGSDVVGERLTDDPREFIKTDRRPPFAIKPGREDEYVYTLADLRPAPRTGHPWALDLPATGEPPASDEGVPPP